MRSPIIALIAVPLITIPAAGAPAATASATPTTPNTTASLVKTVRVDVDGDGVADTVKLFHLEGKKFKLQVITATKKSSVRFTSAVSKDNGVDSVWYGASKMDRVAGAELVVLRWTTKAVKGKATIPVGVYTWRKGKLVAQKAPTSPRGSGWRLSTSYTNFSQGYRFFMKSGKRYVDTAYLDMGPEGENWRGKTTRSVWKHKKWVKVSTRKVNLNAIAAARYQGMHGVPFLVSTGSADIDGDGRGDSLVYERLVDNRGGFMSGVWRLTVHSAAGHSASAKVASSSINDPLVGAALVDGVAGRELVFERSEDDPRWQIFTWRGNALVADPAPVSCDTYLAWSPCGEEISTNFTFSAINGERYVVAKDTLAGASEGEVRFNKSVWRSGKWALVSAWREIYSREQMAKFEAGLFGLQIYQL